MSDEITPEQVERLRRDIGASDLRDVDRRVVATFEGTRQRTDRQDKHIVVEVGREDGKWFVTATDEDGRVATGNPDSSLDVTLDLAALHWRKLDNP